MKYGVSIPVAGFVYTEVEADSEKEAIEKAFDVDHTPDDIEEWGIYEKIVSGNVLHVPLNEAEAEKIED